MSKCFISCTLRSISLSIGVSILSSPLFLMILLLNSVTLPDLSCPGANCIFHKVRVRISLFIKTRCLKILQGYLLKAKDIFLLEI